MATVNEVITPIQTEYKGYRFRSRLEARWAVFFDAIGIEYEYEPEGVILQDGTWYLPDFYLIDFKCFFEVKHKDVEGTDGERIAEKKIGDGAQQWSWAGIICYGDPMDDNLRIHCTESDDDGGGEYAAEVTIGLHPETHKPYLFSYYDWKPRNFFTGFNDNSDVIPMVTCERGKYSYDSFVNGTVCCARETARQSRFEYNERKKEQ